MFKIEKSSNMPIGAVLGAIAPLIPTIFSGISKVKGTAKNSTNYSDSNQQVKLLQQQNAMLQKNQNNSNQTNDMMKYAIPACILSVVLILVIKR